MDSRYGHLTAYNATHLGWQQVHARNGSTIYEAMIVRTDRG